MQHRYKQSARILTVLMVIWLLASFAGVAMAGAAAAAQGAAAQQTSSIDAVLVVDISNSMNTSDTNKVGNEAMKMFIDMLSARGDKVGIVAYTDKVQREKALLKIQSPEDKQDLKNFIDGLDRGPYTDIAVGVREAVKVLQNGAEPGHEPMIVLLADGNNDFNKNSGRTQSESDRELGEAVDQAKAAGIPIYTIGLNADGKLNKAPLEDLADQTGAKSFSTSSADDLPQILSEIFASHLKLKIVPIQSMTGTGSFQEVTVNVPNANVLEANISIMSSKPVEAELVNPSGDKVAVPSDDVILSKSKSYSLIKLLTPAEGDWKLRVKGAAKDKIDINLVFNYDLKLEMDKIAAKSYKPGDKVDIGAYLTSNGQKLQNDELYTNMNAVLIVKDLDSGKTEELKLNNTGERFEGTFRFAEAHDYELKVRAEEKSFYRETDPVTLSAKDNAGGAAATPAGPPAGSAEKPFPWLIVAGSAAALAVLAAAAYFIAGKVKQANRGFVGQIVIEIRDENTSEKSFPQYKKLTAFKGKFNLHQLLQLAPELKETEKVVFTPAKGDRITLRNASAARLEKSGRAVDAAAGLELKSGDRVSLSLQQIDKTIFIEYLV
ncbi:MULTISPECIES: vWA domain-containing protein [Paenibacillus]|uniref:VWA domain-containing protein n=3 Tax=Paenibacillus TaxID=44249 RepID=A0A6N8EYS6_PAEMA|nr:VWA domain-containing protein [Paenibacillus macerans]MUG24824.1 VWA domain-containing protein [Paenibacillus macerans]SUA86130.1 von Willebrand factor type A [Paenibacillus macerans]GBK63769.1 VWA domain-containing protein [Paenibacillus macerans]GBK70082.1 VWA domain-containing protein [Paenibacillus macerans]